MNSRGSWGSRLGFILAVAGSAVGLANIWRLPYVIGENGGAAFLLIYLIALFAIGFPVFFSEMILGARTKSGPIRALASVGRGAFWGKLGGLTIITGLLVSAFYSVIAGWILSYLFLACMGGLQTLTTPEQASQVFLGYTSHLFYPSLSHFSFLLICSLVLYGGVHQGIEKWNKIMMPALLLILCVVLVWGLSLPNAMDGIYYLLKPDWHELTPQAFMIALGQAFFTLSIGQGTMITYGSYLKSDQGILKSCMAVVLMDTLVAILAAFAIFAIVFSMGVTPDSGPSLIFNTLPVIFSKIPGGGVLSILFFLLVLFAAITSQISAMEPSIAYLYDHKGMSRGKATLLLFIVIFILGTPCSLAYGPLASVSIRGLSILDFISHFVSSILIPIGGFVAIFVVGWRWGVAKALTPIVPSFSKPWVRSYFIVSIKYIAPILIGVIFIHAFW